MLDPSELVKPNCVPCKEDNFCWDNAIIESEIDADNLVRDGGHGNMKTTGLCPSGFKCVQGANIIGPNFHYSDNTNHYMCREGYYCDNANYAAGTAVEVQCATGTYMPYEGAEVVGDCISCKAGYECANAGTATPTSCPAGFYCIEGTDTSVDQCQPGEYCPTNAEKAFLCPFGSYTAGTAETSCTPAAAGAYVDTEGASAEIACTAGYYCEAGQVQPVACPEGQTSTASATAIGDCTDMPLGEFRLGPNAADNGIIEEGYYGKLVGESFNIPTRYGGVCGPGSFCTAGLRADCAAGTYCEYELMSTNTD
jgi:hypothetical protein